ncbi:hypothetical protein NPIL_493531, partial [Nephila pilipes]
KGGDDGGGGSGSLMRRLDSVLKKAPAAVLMDRLMLARIIPFAGVVKGSDLSHLPGRGDPPPPERASTRLNQGGGLFGRVLKYLEAHSGGLRTFQGSLEALPNLLGSTFQPGPR